MLWRLIHPDMRTLSDFADGALPEDRARRVKRHVAVCRRCRDRVWTCRRVDAAAQELAAPPELPVGLRERVLARRAAGDDVILPLPALPATSHGYARARGFAVAAVVVVLMGIGILVGTPTLTADASELRIMPAAPQAGDTIRVEYRATARLNGHDVLVLRARHAVPHTIMATTTYTVLTHLVRGRDGKYRGAFVLPDDVTYAVLAVEDPAARDVDHNGEKWEVLLHGADGVPRLDALNRRQHDLSARNRVLAADAADETVRLYPASMRARLDQLLSRTELASREEAEEIRDEHRAGLPALLAVQPEPLDATTIAEIIFYADYSLDTTTARIFRERLIASYPLHPAAQQQRVFALFRGAARDTLAYWKGMEALWLETESLPRHGQIAFSAWQAAQQWRDEAALARWGRRLTAQEPDAGVGRTFAGVPSLRDEGIALLQRALEKMDDTEPWQRALTHTADEYATAVNRYRGGLLASLGSALAAAGRAADADAALAQAVELAWQPQLFRSVAETRFRGGDTLAALQLLARVAVDPATPAPFADSVRARAGSHWDDTRWAGWRQDALAVMQRHTMFLATNRAVRGRPRLQNASGSQQTLDPATGEITFVAFWNRYCPPSQMQLPALAQLARTLQARGVRVVTITEERPSESLAAFLASSNVDMPVLHDANFEARQAFDNFATPVYLVVDGEGRIRFQGHGLEDVQRQVHLLQRAAQQ